jgi:hypothetical protein
MSDTSPVASVAQPTSRTSEWCDKCSGHVFHDVHPEFGVHGKVEVQSDFNVDLLALVKAWPSDWARIREEEDRLDEALNALICGVLIEGEEWGPWHEPKGFIRLNTDDPDLDWREPRDDSTFWARLTAALEAEGLWGEVPEVPEDPRSPGPGQIGLDLTPPAIQ